MTIWTKDDRTELKHLFDTCSHCRAFISSALDLGFGTIDVDIVDHPSTALLSYPPMNCVVGDSGSDYAEELIKDFPQMNLLIVPGREWAGLVKDSWGDRIKIQYRTTMDPSTLDLDKVRKLKTKARDVGAVYEIDLNILKSSDNRFWKVMLPFFGTFETFLELGHGYCVKHEDRVVSVAYSAFPYSRELEIQVRTLDSPDYRRMGFATTVSASLIEWALKSSIIPHWDAANTPSVLLAKKLGYGNPDPYEAFFWADQGN